MRARHEMWVEKYRPENPYQMVGNEDVRIGFGKWISTWKKGRKPALLSGPPGTGKTTLVHAVAKNLGFTVIELNASDSRTKAKLERRLGPSLSNISLLDEKLLIFLDEVDGIYGVQDRGGVEFVQELIKGSTIPVVMAANVADDSRVQKLASKSVVFRFRRIPSRLVEMHLREILRREGVSITDRVVEDIVRGSGGDMRVAVNTLQVTASRPDSSFQGVTIDRVAFLTLREALDRLFEAEDSAEGRRLLRRCNALSKEKLRSVFSSIVSSGLSADEVVNVLEGLSRADLLLGWIVRSQEWRLLRYLDSLIASAVVEHLPRGKVRYGVDDMPWPLKLRIWNEGRVMTDMASELARMTHTSRRSAAALYLPYLALMVGVNKDCHLRASRLLRLDESGEKVLMKESERMKELIHR